MKDAQFVIPEIYCPFSSEINPLVEEIQAHNLSQIQRFHHFQAESTLQSPLAIRLGKLTAMVHPTARLDDLHLISDWHIWLCLFDDLFDEGEPGRNPVLMQSVLSSLLAVISDPSVIPSDPLATSLANFWQRITLCTGIIWQRQFFKDIVDFFDGYAWETLNRVQNIIPTLESYIAHRWKFGGVLTAFDLIEVAHHIELPERVYDCEEFQMLRRRAANVVCWHNDLYSFQKEVGHGDVHNMVIVIQDAQSCTIQEAFNRAAHLVDEQVHLFLETERQLPSFSPSIDQDLQKYLTNLRHWMIGNLEWSRETIRYSATPHTGPLQRVNLQEVRISS